MAVTWEVAGVEGVRVGVALGLGGRVVCRAGAPVVAMAAVATAAVSTVALVVAVAS